MNIKTTRNKEYAAEIKRKLTDNDGYCPCSIIKNEETKCMCKAFRDQVENGIEGTCHCGLWVATK